MHQDRHPHALTRPKQLEPVVARPRAIGRGLAVREQQFGVTVAGQRLTQTYEPSSESLERIVGSVVERADIWGTDELDRNDRLAGTPRSRQGALVELLGE